MSREVKPYSHEELQQFYGMLNDYEDGAMPSATPKHHITLRLIATIKQLEVEVKMAGYKHIPMGQYPPSEDLMAIPSVESEESEESAKPQVPEGLQTLYAIASNLRKWG